jgi:hypothetical protein
MCNHDLDDMISCSQQALPRHERISAACNQEVKDAS